MSCWYTVLLALTQEPLSIPCIGYKGPVSVIDEYTSVVFWCVEILYRIAFLQSQVAKDVIPLFFQLTSLFSPQNNFHVACLIDDDSSLFG